MYIGYVVFTTRDLLFFTRKKQFSRELSAHSVQTLSGIFDRVLNTTKEKWAYHNKQISYPLFNNYQFVYSNHYENIKIATIYHKRVEIVSFQWDVYRKKILGNSSLIPSSLLAKATFDHLDSLYQEIIQQIKHAQTKQDQLLATTASLLQQQKERDHLEECAKLSQFLTTVQHASTSVELNEFSLQYVKQAHNEHIQLGYNGTVFYEALCLLNSKKISTQFLHTLHGDALIFKQLEDELLQFTYAFFARNDSDVKVHLTNSHSPL